MLTLFSSLLRYIFGSSEKENLRAELQTRYQELEELQVNFIKEVASREKLAEILSEKEEEIAEVQKKFHYVIREREDLKNNLNKISSEMKILKQQIKDQNWEKTKLASSYEEKLKLENREKNDLNDKLFELINEQNELEDKLKLKNESIMGFESTLAKLISDFENVSKKLENKKQDYESVEYENNQLKQELKKLMAEHLKHQQKAQWNKIIDLIPSTVIIKNLKVELKYLKSQLKSALQELAHEKEIKESLELLLQETKENLANLQNNYDASQRECHKLRQENEKISMDLEVKTLEAYNYQRDFENSNKNLEMKDRKIFILEEQLEAVRSEVASQCSTQDNEEIEDDLMMSNVVKQAKKLDRLMKKSCHIHDDFAAAGDTKV